MSRKTRRPWQRVFFFDVLRYAYMTLSILKHKHAIRVQAKVVNVDCDISRFCSKVGRCRHGAAFDSVPDMFCLHTKKSGMTQKYRYFP
jgi:hypothetical protein